MKLTKEHKQILEGLGVSSDDFRQISEVMDEKHTTYELEDVVISREEAIKILGMETYLSGISRSAFHCSAMRDSSDGEQSIYFDSSSYFD